MRPLSKKSNKSNINDHDDTITIPNSKCHTNNHNAKKKIIGMKRRCCIEFKSVNKIHKKFRNQVHTYINESKT